MKKATIYKAALAVLTGLAAALPSAMMAAAPASREIDWTPQIYWAQSGAASSTHAVTGTGFSWVALAVGNTAAPVKLEIWTTTKTYTASGVAPSMVVSSTIYLLDGRAYSGDFTSLALNPRLVFTGVVAGTTVYPGIEYGEARK